MGQRAPAANLSTEPHARALPVWPLIVTIAVQALATMALLSVPTAAPEIAADLGVPGALVGVFVSLVYAVGILSSLLSPGFIHRFGAVRVSQAVLLCTVAMLVIAAGGGGILGLAFAAATLGLGYGAAAPASAHLLVPRTPSSVFNLVMSIRQIGLPLGGVAAALIVPPLVLVLGWRAALAVEIGPVLVLILAVGLPRRRWDAAREPGRRVLGPALLDPFRLLRRGGGFVVQSLASFIYSGAQLCFVAFMTVQLTAVAGFSLVEAGLALAAYQASGALARPGWGWVADRLVSPGRLMALLGLLMAGACIAFGLLGRGWPLALVILAALAAGASAGGYGGILYAEYARLGGSRRTEATGLGTASMFGGIVAIPSCFGIAVAHLGSYLVPYAAIALAILAAAALLWRASDAASSQLGNQSPPDLAR